MEKHLKESRYLEVRALDNEDKMILEGYAVMFDSPATHYGYTEIVDKKAFNNCNMQDVSLKYNHEDNFLILARTRNESLKLIVDDIGLKFRAELIDTSSNKDVYKMVLARLIDKCSFAFTVDKEEYDYETDTRRILSIDKLFDVSVVDVPFYESTNVVARSKEEFIKEKELKLEKEKLKLLLSL
uniref:Prohead serine protease n=1 Tax=Myoviridae sp. ctXho31 TaxID=2825122 RepID=A0A8S5TWP7_9CAUD|nr:MAG TPA: prohead serine protease [Myoviridae sp. ctXho31]